MAGKALFPPLHRTAASSRGSHQFLVLLGTNLTARGSWRGYAPGGWASPPGPTMPELALHRDPPSGQSTQPNPALLVPAAGLPSAAASRHTAHLAAHIVPLVARTEQQQDSWKALEMDKGRQILQCALKRIN